MVGKACAFKPADSGRRPNWRYCRTEPAALLGMAALRSLSKAAETVASREFERLWFTQDHREAEAAFMEKRKPVFAGK
jgi:hypothetical protein